MRRAGARNVADAIAGFKQVSMGDVIGWNPSVIFVQERYSAVVGQIKADPAWANSDEITRIS